MSKTLLYVSLIWGMSALVHSDYASEASTSTEESVPIPSSIETPTSKEESVILKEEENNSVKDLGDSIRMSRRLNDPGTDWERVKFLNMEYILEPDHYNTNTIFHTKVKRIVKSSLSQLSSPQVVRRDSSFSLSTSVTAKDHEDYAKHIQLKGKTTYNLPYQVFEDGYLISTQQILAALVKLGIDEGLANHVDARKFRLYCIRCLELPPSKLSLKEEADVLNSYLTRIQELGALYEMRLKEDAFSLLGFVSQRDYVRGYANAPTYTDETVASRYIKSSYMPPEATKDADCIANIVANIGYNTDGLDKLLAPLECLNPLHTFTVLCEILDKGSYSWNPANQLLAPVRAAEKIRSNVNIADITEEVKETAYSLLGRKFTKIVLETIAENFDKAQTNKTGFKDSEVDDIY